MPPRLSYPSNRLRLLIQRIDPCLEINGRRAMSAKGQKQTALVAASCRADFPSSLLDCSTSGLSDLCRFSDYDRIRDLFPGSRVVVAEAGSAGFGRLFPQSGRPRLHLPAIAKSQRVKASRNIERPADPEAHRIIPVIARGSVAEGRADEIRPAAPGAAADDAGGAVSTRPR